jgi:hypothetical protein
MNKRHTRKIRKPVPAADIILPRIDHLAEQYKVFIKEGAILFNYMTHTFDSMFESNTVIRNFEIYEGFYGLSSFIDDIIELHGKEIQTQLIPWIYNEMDSGELFYEVNWKPVRDPDAITIMSFLGYRKIFMYKNYYFRLGLASNCELLTEDCINCKNGLNRIYFCLGLYGWSDEEDTKWIPHALIPLKPSNWIPDSYWERES